MSSSHRKDSHDGKLPDLDTGREHPISRAIHVILLLLMLLLAVVMGFLGYYVVVINRAALDSEAPALVAAPPHGHEADQAQA